uniref:Uncharacterized protein n=1 Tax=Picea glauca TaxID=3330 RepID=A0A101LYI7_PICGL|nr:hypothetical protein ABT39_MTgene5867 [Picea glauca]QHR92107.1 hypothetical protein Q903MT_gene6143 [Picea sitchensis]
MHGHSSFKAFSCLLLTHPDQFERCGLHSKPHRPAIRGLYELKKDYDSESRIHQILGTRLLGWVIRFIY